MSPELYAVGAQIRRSKDVILKEVSFDPSLDPAWPLRFDLAILGDWENSAKFNDTAVGSNLGI